jgi:outer membrane protein TolC
MKKGLVLLLLLHLRGLLLFGQNNAASPTPDWQTTFFDSPTIALPLLTAAAIKHSSELEALELQKGIAHEDLQLARKNILGSVGLIASYNYGNLASVSLTDPNQPNQFTTFSSARYNTGVGLNLPLDRVVGRRNLVQREQLQYRRAEALRQDREKTIRQQVLRQYQDVLLARKLLTIYQEAYLSAQLNFQLVEKQFRKGQVQLSEYTPANERYTRAALEQATAISQYETAFMLLEEIVGDKISALMTSK